MFETITNFFKKFSKQNNQNSGNNSKNVAKERLHLVLMQDRANVSADFLDLMKQEIIEVIKKYIDVDENAIDVRLTNKTNDDGTTGAPALYANIPIVSIKEEAKKEEIEIKESKVEEKTEEKEHALENQDNQENKEIKEEKTSKEKQSETEQSVEEKSEEKVKEKTNKEA